jgi:hypothetical protein
MVAANDTIIATKFGAKAVRKSHTQRAVEAIGVCVTRIDLGMTDKWARERYVSASTPIHARIGIASINFRDDS